MMNTPNINVNLARFSFFEDAVSTAQAHLSHAMTASTLSTLSFLLMTRNACSIRRAAEEETRGQDTNE